MFPNTELELSLEQIKIIFFTLPTALKDIEHLLFLTMFWIFLCFCSIYLHPFFSSFHLSLVQCITTVKYFTLLSAMTNAFRPQIHRHWSHAEAFSMEKLWWNGKFLSSAEFFYIKTSFILIIDSSNISQSNPYHSAGFWTSWDSANPWLTIDYFSPCGWSTLSCWRCWDVCSIFRMCAHCDFSAGTCNLYRRPKSAKMNIFILAQNQGG